MPRSLVVAALMAALTACASAPAAPDASPSDAEPSASVNPARGLPPGCETIDLRSRTGERINLTGEWTGSSMLFNLTEVVLLNEVGGCVYGTVTGVDPDGSETISNLSGRLSSDLTIEFDVVIVYQQNLFPFGEYSTLVMVIEWDDDGRIRLREDRDPEETASRCPQGVLSCPAPVIWYRVDDARAVARVLPEVEELFRSCDRGGVGADADQGGTMTVMLGGLLGQRLAVLRGRDDDGEWAKADVAVYWVASALVQPYTLPEGEMRASEQEWLDEALDEAHNATMEVIARTLTAELSSRLAKPPTTLLEHPDSGQLRADVALVAGQ